MVNYVGLRHLVDSVVPAVADHGNICVSGSNTAYGWEKQVPVLLELVEIEDPGEALAWCDDHEELNPEGFATYVFSKQALMTWVTHRAPTLAQARSIRLNCAAPGLTETAMPAEIAEKSGSRAAHRRLSESLVRPDRDGRRTGVADAVAQQPEERRGDRIGPVHGPGISRRRRRSPRPAASATSVPARRAA